MRDDAFARNATPMETALNRRRPGPVVYLFPPRAPSRRLSWVSGFVCGLTVAGLALLAAMVL